MKESTDTLRKALETLKQNTWLTGAEVKRMLQISESTLVRMRKRRLIPYVNIGKSYYYPSLFFERVMLERTLATHGGQWLGFIT